MRYLFAAFCCLALSTPTNAIAEAVPVPCKADTVGMAEKHVEGLTDLAARKVATTQLDMAKEAMRKHDLRGCSQFLGRAMNYKDQM